MVATKPEALPLSPDELCKRDADRLVHLRADPTSEEASRFAGELSCEKLRPQLSRLMESLGFAIPAPATPAPMNLPPAPQVAAAEPKPVSDCASQQAALDRLRADPSIDAAQAFWRELQCERLRPQARMLMESLDIVVDEPAAHPLLGDTSAALAPKGNDVRAVVAPGDSVTADPTACDREKQELESLRANPDRRSAERFARGNDLRRAEAAGRAAAGQPERLTVFGQKSAGLARRIGRRREPVLLWRTSHVLVEFGQGRFSVWMPVMQFCTRLNVFRGLGSFFCNYIFLQRETVLSA